MIFVKGRSPLTLRGETVRGIRRAYSNFDGEPASINRICRDFGISRPDFIELKRALNLTHDSLPFTAHELATRTDEELLGDAEELRKGAIANRLEQAKWTATKRDALRWRQLDATILAEVRNEIRESGVAPREVGKVIPVNPGRRYAVLGGTTDLHVGMFAWAPETGEGYNIEEAARRCRDSLNAHAGKLALRGRPEVVFIGIGSDNTHSDGTRAETTKGTPLDIDGTPYRVFRAGLRVQRAEVDMWRKIADHVVLLPWPGNHSRAWDIAAMAYMAGVYEDCPDVHVHDHLRTRSVTSYGATMIALHHGDKTKPAKLPAVVSCENPQTWARCPHRVILTGHLHHYHTRQIGGCMLVTLPSLAGADRWHADGGWVTSKAGSTIHLIDYDNGPDEVLHYWVPGAGASDAADDWRKPSAVDFPEIDAAFA